MKFLDYFKASHDKETVNKPPSPLANRLERKDCIITNAPFLSGATT